MTTLAASRMTPSPQPHATSGTGSHSSGAPAECGPDAVLLEEMVHLSLRLRRHGFDLESATGLSGRELDLVALLCEEGPASVKSLVADLQTPRSTMTAIVDRLEDRGLVRRHPNPQDRRSVVLEATPLAEEALASYRRGMERLTEHVRKVLGEQDRADLTRLLHTLGSSL